MDIKIAILDLYNGTPNQGMRALNELLSEETNVGQVMIYDVRAKNELPDLSYDIYISTGGPGDPREGDGIWDRRYYEFLENLVQYNARHQDKKHLFLICHSFQMACYHFGVGTILKRDVMSFGTFPVDKTHGGQHEPLMKSLSDPFYVADFRSYQVVHPNHDELASKNYKILALEDHTQSRGNLRAIMGVRFSEEIIGFQFHPEADSKGMILHFADEARKAQVIKEYGQERYDSMIEDLKDPEKIMRTHGQIIPEFLKSAIDQKMEAVLV